MIVFFSFEYRDVQAQNESALLSSAHALISYMMGTGRGRVNLVQNRTC